MASDKKIDELIDILKTLLIIQLLDRGLSQAEVRGIAKVKMSTVSDLAKKLTKKTTNY